MQVHPFLKMINISQQEIWTTQSRLRNGGCDSITPLSKNQLTSITWYTELLAHFNYR